MCLYSSLEEWSNAYCMNLARRKAATGLPLLLPPLLWKMKEARSLSVLPRYFSFFFFPEKEVRAGRVGKRKFVAHSHPDSKTEKKKQNRIGSLRQTVGHGDSNVEDDPTVVRAVV